jgi:hypothetical protein
MSEELDLDALADEMSAMGLGERIDFYIGNRADSSTMHSSEHIGLSFRDGEYHLWYFDMGSRRSLLDTSDGTAARRQFLDETIKLAAGRGYGPGVEPNQ